MARSAVSGAAVAPLRGLSGPGRVGVLPEGLSLQAAGAAGNAVGVRHSRAAPAPGSARVVMGVQPLGILPVGELKKSRRGVISEADSCRW